MTQKSSILKEIQNLSIMSNAKEPILVKKIKKRFDVDIEEQGLEGNSTLNIRIRKIHLQMMIQKF